MTKTRVPGHKPSSLPWVDRNKAHVFLRVVANTGPGTQARSSLSFLPVAQEGKGLARCIAFAPHSVRKSRAPTSIYKFITSVCDGARVQVDRAGVLSVEVLKPRSLLKLSPQSRGPKNYSRHQPHTFTSLLTESRVLNPDQSRSQVPTPRLQITYWGAYGQRAER